MLSANQKPEQFARDKIDSELLRSGWLIQNKSPINLAAGVGVAVREYQTNVGPADSILLVNKKPGGVIEKGIHSPEEIKSSVNQYRQLIEKATNIFNDPDLRNYIIDVRKKYDQVIDTINADEIVNMGSVKDNQAAAEGLVHEFREWIEQHKTEITALQIFYG